MAVREQAEQHELEGVALADDGALDLVQDPSGELADLLERQLCLGAHGFSLSDASTARSISCS